MEEYLPPQTFYYKFEELKDVVSLFQKLNIKKYNIYRDKLFYQKKPENVYSIYKWNPSYNLEYVSSYKGKDQFSQIDVVENAIVLTIYNPLVFFEFENLIIPILYVSELEKSCHIACLHIDMNAKKAYLLDPNGVPSYFNPTVNIENEIELMLSDYFKLINVKYIKCSWNLNRISLNSINSEFIGSGHCVVLSLIISYLVHKKMNHYDIYQSLCIDKLPYIIAEYYIYLSNFTTSSVTSQ